QRGRVPRPAGRRARPDARQATRAADQAHASQVNPSAADFPDGWDAAPIDDELVDCSGFRPDESQLTVTGEAQAPYCSNDVAAGASYVRVFAGEKLARSAFVKEAPARSRPLPRQQRERSGGSDQLVAEPAGTFG